MIEKRKIPTEKTISYTRSLFFRSKEAIRKFVAQSFAYLCCFVAASWWGGAAMGAEASGSLGRAVPDILLRNLDGEAVLPSDFNQARCLVLVFLGLECPIANRYLPRLNEISQAVEFRDCQILGIYAQDGATSEKARQHAKAFDIKFPVLIDAQGKFAQAVGATRMSEAFVVSSSTFRIQYQGRIDDQFGYRTERVKPTREDLRMAIEQVLSSELVQTPFTLVEGCLLSFAKVEEADPLAPTWSEHAAVIIQNKCQRCHHAGAVAPFELSSLEDVYAWKDMIGEVLTSRRMPPWHADPRHGDFANDRSLADQERLTLLAWLRAGLPAGDAEKAPRAKEFAEGWMIEQPDKVFELPEEVSIPADGVLPYKYFEIKNAFPEDVYVSAAEAVPGNRAAVHHIITFYKPPGEDLGKNLGLERNWIVGAAPGDMPLMLPSGVALKIPAGSSIVWQMHYTPTGKPERDRSRLGLRFYRGPVPPQHLVQQAGLYNEEFAIPPGAHHHPVATRSLTIEQDSLLLSLMPHMHLRGKSFRYVAELPSGEVRTLLSVPRYDFNWQSAYDPKEPVLLPKGSKLYCQAAFNNSKDNPANPDPSQTVRWGEQTFEEMMIGYVKYVHAKESVAQPDVASP